MREQPILFSGPMVRAILDGSKTQTRRVVTPQPNDSRDIPNAGPWTWWNRANGHRFRGVAGCISEAEFCRAMVEHCPYGNDGDRLWCRETSLLARDANGPCPAGNGRAVAYAADGYELEDGERWTPSIHMPRWASRLTLDVTEVRVERVMDILPSDVREEGFESRADFASLWDSLNAKRDGGAYSWERNPFVWCISFRLYADAPGGR